MTPFSMCRLRRCAGVALALVAGACAGHGQRPLAMAPTPLPVTVDSAAHHDSLGAALVRQSRDSAADQKVLDTLHRGVTPSASEAQTDRAAAPAPVVRGEDVQKEAEQLFGSKDGKQAVGAAPPTGEPLFDIDVTTFGTNRRVLDYLEFFQVDARDRFGIWLQRLGRYEGMIRERFRAKGLPEDLVYLTLVESGLSNTAVSRSRAVGMWQFMSGTARTYGLTVDPWVDERRDPFKATDAAVNYLSDLVQRLGSVYLAAAAYNAGAGRIERGVARLPGETDSLTDNTFFQLAANSRYLRRETRDYVPKLIAASLIGKQPDRYGFTDIVRMPPLVFDEITIPDATGLDVIARLADTSIAAIVELNPQFVRGVTPPGREVTVRVPRGRGQSVAERFDSLPVNERITFVDHYVTSGQTLSGIALRYHVSVAMIRSANPQLRPAALHIGQRLIIPMSGKIVPAAAWSVPPQPRSRHPARRRSLGTEYRVRPGETASAIARRYGVSLSALLDENDMAMASILHAGDRLRIPPPRH